MFVSQIGTVEHEEGIGEGEEVKEGVEEGAEEVSSVRVLLIFVACRALEYRAVHDAL